MPFHIPCIPPWALSLMSEVQRISSLPSVSPRPFDESPEKVDTGIKTVEATHKVYGKYSKWFLFVGYAIMVDFSEGKLTDSSSLDWGWHPTSTPWTVRPRIPTLPSPRRI